jgi:hypothetical protein
VKAKDAFVGWHQVDSDIPQFPSADWRVSANVMPEPECFELLLKRMKPLMRSHMRHEVNIVRHTDGLCTHIGYQQASSTAANKHQ